jgi:hypothetical protein
MIRNFILAFIVLLISGCTVAPISSTHSESIKNEKTAVVFNDMHKLINYVEDHYWVLGVSQTSSQSKYEGIWDSNFELEILHSEKFNTLGLKADAITQLLNQELLEALKARQIQVAKIDRLSSGKQGPILRELSQRIKKDPIVVIPTEILDELKILQYRYMIWIDAAPLLVHIQTLGLPTLTLQNLEYKIFDLESHKMIWESKVGLVERLERDGKTGKEVLESNNLQGLKEQISFLHSERYKIRTGKGLGNKSIGQHIGLE